MYQYRETRKIDTPLLLSQSKVLSLLPLKHRLGKNKFSQLLGETNLTFIY